MNERGRVVGRRTADTDRSADGHRSWVHDNRKPQRSRVPASVIIVIYLVIYLVRPSFMSSDGHEGQEVVSNL